MPYNCIHQHHGGQRQGREQQQDERCNTRRCPGFLRGPDLNRRADRQRAKQQAIHGEPTDLHGGRADRAFQGFGKVTLGKDGGYRFRTLKPAPYSGRTPHIHVKVKLDGQELLTTQFYVQGDPGNARDFLWRRLGEEGQAALTRPFVNGPDGMKAEYAVVVQA